MHNTKKTQKKYPSIFSILLEGSTISDLEPFGNLDDARTYVDDYHNSESVVIVEYTPTAVYSPEWVKESLIE